MLQVRALVADVAIGRVRDGGGLYSCGAAPARAVASGGVPSTAWAPATTLPGFSALMVPSSSSSLKCGSGSTTRRATSAARVACVRCKAATMGSNGLGMPGRVQRRVRVREVVVAMDVQGSNIPLAAFCCAIQCSRLLSTVRNVLCGYTWSHVKNEPTGDMNCPQRVLYALASDADN
jgi:hypothetical protein